MNWQNEWKAISARVASLTPIGTELLHPFYRNGKDKSLLFTVLTRQANDIKVNLEVFQESFKVVLPSEVNQAITVYLSLIVQNPFIPTNGEGGSPEDIAAHLLNMRILVAEVDYLLTNTSETIKRQSERTFLHIQQSIVAAEDIQQRWQKAFNTGETACEKLGAAHLLLHGIYAFKANAEGARTDLVFPDRPLNTDTVQRTADGLVLTEWKKVKRQTEASTKAEQARKQAALYNAGILGGIELANYRYIVLVSEEQLDRMDDIEENGVTYRHINIAVAPLSPSKQAVK